MERVEEERVRKRELYRVVTLTSLQILPLPKLASLGTDCHASPPSMDNQSFFEESSMGTRALGSPFLLANGKTQIFGNFIALHISYERKNFI